MSGIEFDAASVKVTIDGVKIMSFALPPWLDESMPLGPPREPHWKRLRDRRRHKARERRMLMRGRREAHRRGLDVGLLGTMGTEAVLWLGGGRAIVLRTFTVPHCDDESGCLHTYVDADGDLTCDVPEHQHGVVPF